MSTAVEFSFTGFLPWGSERSNPSQELVQEIREKFTPENIRVLYTRVIPVTAKAASAAVHNLHTALRLRREEYPEITQVLIHIGLHGSSTQFYLERRGVNEARIKGEVEGRIIPEFARDHHLVTTLKLQAGYPQKIKESEDAGLFVCNYTYYLSLLAGLHSGVHCLFIHVPHFERISKLEQLRTLALIVKGIESNLLASH